MNSIVISVLVTWTIMAILLEIAEESASDKLKYVICAPLFIIVKPIYIIARKIYQSHICNNYDCYRIGIMNVYVNYKFAKQIGLPLSKKVCDGKQLKSLPPNSRLVDSYDDFRKLGFTRNYIDDLCANSLDLKAKANPNL